MDKGRIVVVLTLGRSGSSTLTSGLKVLGVDLGENLLNDPYLHNLKGKWEDVEIVNLNMKILQSLNTYQWKVDGVDQIDANKIPIDLRDRALNLIKRNTDKYNLYGFKDVMSWKIIPFWKEIFHQLSLSPIYIIAVRNPVNVVGSIAKMGVIKSSKIYALWLECIVTIMKNTHGENCLVVDYDQLLDDPAHQMHRIAKILNISKHNIDGKYFQEYVEEFVDKNLCHSDSLYEKINEEACLPDMIQRCYEILLELSADNLLTESLQVRSFFDDSYLQLKNSASVFKAINSLEDSLNSFKSHLEDALLKSLRLSG